MFQITLDKKKIILGFFLSTRFISINSSFPTLYSSKQCFFPPFSNLSSFSFRQFFRRPFPKKKKSISLERMRNNSSRKKRPPLPPLPPHSFSVACGRRSGKKGTVEEDHFVSSRTPPLATRKGKLVKLRAHVFHFSYIPSPVPLLAYLVFSQRHAGQFTSVSSSFSFFMPLPLHSLSFLSSFSFHPSLFLLSNIRFSSAPTKQGRRIIIATVQLRVHACFRVTQPPRGVPWMENGISGL